MTLDSFNAVFYTVAFIVPGFVWSSVLSMMVARRSQATEIRAIEFLTLSCINYGVWSWAIFLLFRGSFADTHRGWTAVFLFLIVFVSPVGLGLLSGVLTQRDSVARFLSRFGFHTLHPLPTAWDYHFIRGRPYWATVTLKDGSRIYGFYGLQSFAGDDPDCRDLYLEAAFRPTEAGDLAPVEDTGGVLIMSDQIAVIEFRDAEEMRDG